MLKYLPRVSVTATKLDNPLFGDYTFVNATLTRDFKRFQPFVNYLLTKLMTAGTNHGLNFGGNLDTGKYGQFRVQHNLTFSKTPLLNEAEVRCRLSGLPCPVSGYSVNNSSSFIDWTTNRPLLRRLQLSLGGGYIKAPDRTSAEYRGTASLPLPFRQMLQVGYYYGAFNREFRINMAGPLAFWRHEDTFANPVTNEALLEDSTINGRIYLDENGNREYDAGVDVPMPGVRIRLNNGSEMISDASGQYSFQQVHPGDNNLALDIADVRASLVPANGLEQTVTVAPRTVVNTAFRLVKSGSLSGRVWHDANENGTYEVGEGLPDIRLVSSSGRDTYTDPDGSFLLSELPPGQQTIFIDERYKPEDMLIPGTILRVEVSSGKNTPGVQFIFKTKPRGKKIINFDQKPPGE